MCAEAKRAAEPRRYFPQFGPALTSMARFSNLKTAVKKKYMKRKVFEGVEGVGKGEKRVKKTTIAAVFRKEFSRRLGLQTDKLPSGM